MGWFLFSTAQVSPNNSLFFSFNLGRAAHLLTFAHLSLHAHTLTLPTST